MISVPKVTDLDRAFPTSLPLNLPLLGEIPDEYRTDRGAHTKWNRLFEAVFYGSIIEWSTFGAIPHEGVVAADAWRVLEVLAGVFDIKHEHKEAAWAYLASQWFSDCRWQTKTREVVPFEDAELEAAWVTRFTRPGQATEYTRLPQTCEPSNKGCRHHYSGGNQCECPPETCWYNYAKQTQKDGGEPLIYQLWMLSGTPMPPAPPPTPRAPVKIRSKPKKKKS